MNYLFLDLEMTGSEAGYHDIIQIGAVLTNDKFDVLAEYTSLVYPENEEVFSEEAEEIHGISIHDLEDAPMIHEVLDEFETWIRKTLHRKNNDPIKDVVVCGQSILNDINFLMAADNNQHILWPFSFRILDLMTLTETMYRIFDAKKMERPKSYSLRAVSKYLKIAINDQKHDALEDARLTLQCFQGYYGILDAMLDIEKK
jgi:DNA polymerase-3 subunit epsilon